MRCRSARVLGRHTSADPCTIGCTHHCDPTSARGTVGQTGAQARHKGQEQQERQQCDNNRMPPEPLLLLVSFVLVSFVCARLTPCRRA